ncbi:spermidine synthase [Tomitella biformata]|uniref:spermidine synthase n=1 Tax=Tomitella biformata TaxID=630403 RepID=UPI0004637D5B|nr:fused MFS/spermidine synthase [Tomitella biformata]
MGRRRETRTSTPATPKTGGPVEGVFEIDTGTCELLKDRWQPGAWILKINGAESSHIDVDDASSLDFEYMRWFAALIGPHWAPDVRLRALHLGGGACTMARYLADDYPDARQVVVEIDGKLTELVREWFDLPRAPLLRIRVGEARAVLETLTADSRDLIIRDVFAGILTPTPLTTLEFTQQARRVLSPGGIYVVNCGDTRDLAVAKRECATIAKVFEHVVVISDHAMLKGRRTGNIVIAGSDVPIGDSAASTRDLLMGAVPAALWQTEQVARFASGAAVLTDPPPPVTP